MSGKMISMKNHLMKMK